MNNNILPVGKDIIKKFSNINIKLEKNPRKIIDETKKLSINFKIMNEGIKIIN